MDNSNNNKSQPQVPPQPQFQQAPQQPQVQQPQPQQQFPQQPVMGTPYQMPPKKKMGKGAKWGIIGGIVGLVVIVIPGNRQLRMSASALGASSRMQEDVTITSSK